MSDYVPSNREVRETWMDAMVMHPPATSSAEFDRFINRVREEARDEIRADFVLTRANIRKIKADALREFADEWGDGTEGFPYGPLHERANEIEDTTP